MKFKKLTLLLYMVGVLGCAVLSPIAFAQLVGPADVGRIQPKEEAGLVPILPTKERAVIAPESEPVTLQAPAGAKKIHLLLQAVKFEGVTAFKQEQLKRIYAPYINREVTLDVAWLMAGELTALYRKKGYFLSQAFVPEQHIREGTIVIGAVEGYVGEVELEDKTVAKYTIIKSLTKRLLFRKPVKSTDIEDFLLRLNDLPGLSFRSVMSPLKGSNKNGRAVKITLIPSPEDNIGSVSIDNYGSRFLGPHEITTSYQASFFPLQQTNLSLLTALPLQKLYSFSLKHNAPVTSDISVSLTGGITNAYPGYSLKSLDIKSQSTSAGVTFNYIPLRQRQRNLALRLGIDGKNISTDTFAGVLTREQNRALRLGMNYSNAWDRWDGQSSADVSMSKGISIFGASGKNDPDLSRIGAAPDFVKMNVSLSRLQSITNDLFAIATFSGQQTSDILFSSEEFGYGGQALGRAYDSSEIIGDKGVAGSVELRYNGLASASPDFSITPFVFYDIGKTWSNITGETAVSGSSSGAGFQFSTPIKLNGMVTLALPLTKSVNTPIYGGGNRSPRFLFQASKAF
jgi:hemolysin activation/secretion protein